MNDKLKRLLLYYTISGLLFAAVLSGVVLVEKFRGPAYDTADKLRGVKTDLLRMKAAVADMDSVMRDLKAALPQDFGSRLPEGLVLIRLDDLKRRFKGAEIIAKNFEEKGGEMSLPVSIKAKMDDYTAFVNNVGYLQSLSFPYFQIKNITILQAGEKGPPAVLYNIEGVFRMPLEDRKTEGKK